jgi:hypothetical protein
MKESAMTLAPSNDHDLLSANLQRVFSERDGARRAAAIAELYVAAPVMYEPDAVIDGRDGIDAVVSRLLTQFGPDFSFAPRGPVTGHHGIARLPWRAGPADGPVMVTGEDIAEIVDGRIARLWVLLDARK